MKFLNNPDTGLTQPVLQTMAEDSVYNSLTNNRPITQDKEKHRQMVLGGYNKIMSFLKRLEK